MCWSSKSSLIFFIIAWIFSITLIVRNKPLDRLWGLFFMYVTSMQFLEFLIWLDQPEKESSDCKTGKFKGKLNNTVSQIASIQNFLQPIWSGILGLIFIPPDKNVINRKVFIILLCIYFVLLIIWVFKQKLYSKNLCTIPCKEAGCKNRHLQWQWIDSKYSGKYVMIMYFILLVITMINISKVSGGLFLALFLLFSFIISSSVYPFNKAIGSWWCVSVVLGPLVKLLLPNINIGI
jgi:hypothetical protein